MKQIDFQKIHNYIQKLVDDNSFSGVLGIYADEKTIFEETYGYACFDLLVPNTIDIKFRIGSLTKQFTAVSILKLIEMGKVSVNDKLSEYIEDFPNGDSISIKHLLTQSSGIFDYTEVDDFDVEGKKYKTNSQVVSAIKTFPLQFDPGEKWEYSNSNYILLGYIIENVSGKSFDDFLKSELLTNISMPNTGYDVNNVLTGRSFGYTKNNDKLRHAEYLDMSQPHGAGGMYSTISDLKIWCNCLMNEQIVSKNSFNEMISRQINIEDDISYGYGQVIREHKANGKMIYEVGHFGGMPGFCSYMSMYPESKTSIILLSNLDADNIGEIVGFLKEQVINSL